MKKVLRPSVVVFLACAALFLLALGRSAWACVGMPVRPVAADPVPPPSAHTNVAIDVMPSRTAGVAPLAVFFDTMASVSGSLGRGYHELSFRWDFGDPTAGVYRGTERSRNQAFGPMTSHVFERAGRYSVKLRVRDNRGREQVKSVLIVVADPVTVFAGTNTVCFANGSGPQAFVGCPPGATQVTAQNVEALQPHIGTNRRLLLRRGDKFKSASSVFIRATGPGLIGAFGSGSPPAIATSAEYVFQMEGPRSGLADWRFTDLHVEGGSNSQTLAVGSTAFNVLLLRMSLFKGRAGLNTGIHSIPEGHDIVDGHFVHECDFKALDGYALYTAARRFAFVGNTLTDTVHRSRGSLMRLHWLDRAVISDNQLGPGNIDGGDVLYIPGPPFTGGERSIGNGQYTSRVLISGNVFQSGGGLAKVGPQNVSSDERFRDIIVERNLFLPTPPAWGGLTFDGDVQQATVRDNLFFIQARTGGECIVLRKGGSRGASPSDVSVSHNTCIGAKGIDLLKFQSDSTGVVANNNLVVGEDQQLVSGNGTLAASAGNQMGDAAWAQLSSNSPKQWSEFLPKLKSPAVAAGDNAYTGTLDYRGIPRDERPDVGALEHSRGERVPSTSKSTKAP